jgi:D-alanyl-D-alanine carboxypeptidase
MFGAKKEVNNLAEDWGDEEGRFKLPIKKLIIVALCILAVSIPAYAVYRITSPASDPVTVNTPATLSKPTVNATTAIIGDTLQVTTVLSDHLSGQQVIFFLNDVQIGETTTDSNGQAIFNHVATTPGTYIFVAKCIHV